MPNVGHQRAQGLSEKKQQILNKFPLMHSTFSFAETALASAACFCYANQTNFTTSAITYDYI